jgi:hypothetical protein
MVFAGAYGLISLVLMYALSSRKTGTNLALAIIAIVLIVWMSAVSPSAMALCLLVITILVLVPLLFARQVQDSNFWDVSMLRTTQPPGWYSSLWLWWALLGAILVGIYWKFW